VGVKHKSSTFQGFRAFTRAQGIDMNKDMKLVPIGFGVAPLLAGQVDALVGFTTSEPLRAASKGLKVKEFLFANYGVKMYGLTISTREDLIKSDGATIRSFLKASIRGIKYVAEHPDEVAPAVKKRVTQAKLAQQRKMWDKARNTILFADGPGKRVGVQTSEGWGSTQDILSGLKLIENKVPVQSIYTNAFQP
jgi:ABC-type nitrate/sulfonate/bicarbonate transport system substrate-binding protein